MLQNLCVSSWHPVYSWIVCVGLQHIDLVAPLTDVSLVCFIMLMPVCMFVFCMQVAKAYVSQATMHCMVQPRLRLKWMHIITAWLRSRCAGSSKASNFRSLSLSAVQLACLVCLLSCMHAYMHSVGCCHAAYTVCSEATQCIQEVSVESLCLDVSVLLIPKCSLLQGSYSSQSRDNHV